MPEPPGPRCLCIVSSDPVRSGELLTALRTMVDTQKGLEVIVDRRRGQSGGVTDPLPDDRRHQPFVDVKVKTDGFAIVPYPSATRVDAPISEADHDRLELPLFDADPAELEYSRVLDFVRQRRAVRRRRLALASGVGVALVLLALVPAMKAFTSRTRPAAPPAAESPPAIATAPPSRPAAPAPPSGGPSQRSESARSEPTRTEPTRSEPAPQVVERTDRPRVQARPPAAERDAQPRARPAPTPTVMPSREVPPQPVAPQPQPVPPQPVAPPAVAQPPVAPPTVAPPVALPPSEVTSRPEPPAQTAKAPEAAAPRPQNGASTSPVQSPEPARLPDAAPTNRAPVRSHEVAPQRQAPVRTPEAVPPRQALGRPPDAQPTRQAPTATIPDAAGGSSSDHRGGFGDQVKNLGTVIERDLVDATADAKRQGDDFKALQNRFRRAWDGLKQSFTGSEK